MTTRDTSSPEPSRRRRRSSSSQAAAPKKKIEWKRLIPLHNLLLAQPDLVAQASSRQRVSFQCRIAARCLIAVYIAAVASLALPIRLNNPAWHLSLCEAIVNNGVIFLFALFCSALAAYWESNEPLSNRISSRLRSFSLAGTLLFLIVMIAQGAAAVSLYSQAINASNQQLAVFNKNLDKARSDLSAAPSLPALLGVIQSFTPNASIPAPLAAQPLPAIKSKLLDNLKSTRVATLNRIQEQREQRTLGLFINSLRVETTAFALLVATRMFAIKRRSPT